MRRRLLGSRRDRARRTTRAARAAFGGEVLDRRRAQRRDPVPGRLEIVVDARWVIIPAVADHHKAFERESLLELGDLIAERLWISVLPSHQIGLDDRLGDHSSARRQALNTPTKSDWGM
jgi:hypothetical protein